MRPFEVTTVQPAAYTTDCRPTMLQRLHLCC